MDNQHRKISGYRELDQDTIDLMNKVKLHGQILRELIEETKLHITGQRAAAHSNPDERAGAEEIARLNTAEPERWAALARTQMQEALMFLTRAIAQPTTF